MITDASFLAGTKLNDIASAQLAIVRRYKDAYLVANTVVTVGSAIKIGGILLGLVVGLAALNADGVLKVAGIATAIILMANFMLAGIIVAAIGQINQASLDVAVNTSPFMTDMEKAKAMNVKFTAPESAPGLSLDAPKST